MTSNDPFASDALPEIARWRSNSAVIGIKLRLTVPGASLRRDRAVAA
jgi:hypothetical protein